MPTRTVTFKTDEEFIRFVKEDLLFPCTLTISFKYADNSRHYRTHADTRTVTFEQWSCAWGFQDDRNILMDYYKHEPLGVVRERLAKSECEFTMQVNEFSKEEYVKHVTRHGGVTGDVAWKTHPATPAEIEKEWDNVREDHECYKADPLVKENNMSYKEWWKEINWPTKYEPAYEIAREKACKEYWDNVKTEEEVVNG